MRPRRLWVIDPSVSNPEDEGVREILKDWEGTSRIFRPSLQPGDGPGPGTGYDTDGVVLMGSAVSVHDRLPWIAELSAWLQPILCGDSGIPLLGICFGHQLIAHLAGGRIGYVDDDHAKCVGVDDTHLRGSRLVRGGRGLRVVVSHREEVKQPPADYRVTAERVCTPFDGLEHASLPVFSYQFHPEARGDFATVAGIDPANIDDRVRDDGQRLLGAFRDLIRGCGTRPSRPKKEPAVNPPAPEGTVEGV